MRDAAGDWCPASIVSERARRELGRQTHDDFNLLISRLRAGGDLRSPLGPVGRIEKLP